MTTRGWWTQMVSQLLFLVFAGVSGAADAQPAPNSQVGTSIAPATAGKAESVFRNESPLAGGAWQATPVFSAGFTVGLILGDGRGDNTTRLYATHITANTVKEFSYNGSWTNTSDINLPFYAEGAMLVGDGRLDGSAHVYVGEFSSSGNVREFTWDGTAWSGIGLGTATQQLLTAEWCDPRGDGLLHHYYSTGSAPPNNISYEFTFDGAAWAMESIASPLPSLSQGGFGMAVGPGRNDSVHRLYQGVFDGLSGQNYVYEIFWNGSDWETVEVANIGSGPPFQVMALTLGLARKDDLYRLYAVVRGSGVREFTYDGTAWSQTDEIAIGPEVFNAVVGPGRNDGINRLYIAEYNPSQVVEATFDGAAWQTEVVGTPASGVFRVRVGDGRGDGINRVYSSGAAGVVEFTRQ